MFDLCVGYAKLTLASIVFFFFFLANCSKLTDSVCCLEFLKYGALYLDCLYIDSATVMWGYTAVTPLGWGRPLAASKTLA